MEQLPGQQRHAAVDDGREQNKCHTQQPGLDRHGKGSVGADELRHQSHEKQQALGINPADTHALQEDPRLARGSRGWHSARPRAEAGSTPGADGAEAEPQQVDGAGRGQPAQDTRYAVPPARAP